MDIDVARIDLGTRVIHHETHFAALTIQRYIRGHQCRLKLWSPYGKLTQRRAVKIQRSWRGLLGRRLGFKQWIWYRNYKASVIQGLCTMWHAKRYMRKLRAEHYNKCASMLQKNYRGRLGRKSFAEFKFMIYTKMSTRIQRIARGRQGRRRYKCIQERMYGMTGAYGLITDALKADYVRSDGYRKKITIQDAEVGGLDKWQLFDAVLAQLLGTHRQEIAIEMATILARRHPDFALAPMILFISLYFTWCSFGRHKLVREDVLGEALEVLEDVKDRRHEILRRPDYKNEKDDIPYMLREEDPVSYHHGSLLDEIEYSWFGAQFKRHGKDAYTMILKACFLVAKHHILMDSPRESVRALDSARRYFEITIEKSRNLKKDLYLRNQVFDCLYNKQDKALVSKKVVFESAFLEKPIEADKKKPKLKKAISASEVAKFKKKPRVQLTMTATQRGDLLVIRGVFDDLALVEQCVRNSKLSWDDLGYKYRKSMYIRPYVVFPSDIRGLEDRALIHLSRSLKKKKEDLIKRGLYHNVGEYLADNVRLLGAKTRLSSAFRPLDPQEFVPSSRPPITWGTEYSHSRLTLPMLEYRHAERNLGAMEEYMIRMIQRSFLGFQGRALFRRLWERRAAFDRARKICESERSRYRKVREERYNSATLIQSIFRGFQWRITLSLLHKRALKCQTRFRVYRAQCWYYEEKRRLALGPEVIEMIRRGVEISNRHMMLVVYRCGNNYKVMGEDLLNNLRYDGQVYAPEIKEVLEEYNIKVEARLGKDTVAAKAEKVNIWQQEKVAEFIANNLSLTQMITPVTRELGIGKRDTKLALVLLKTAKGRGIQHVNNLKRILSDQAEHYERYHKIEVYKERIRKEKEEREHEEMRQRMAMRKLL